VRRWTLPVLVLAVTAVTACSGGDAAEVARPAPTTSFTAEDVPVLVPGAPGEPGTVLQPGESGTMPNAAAYADEDVAFVTAMVPHHAQALEMAALVPDRAQDDRVKRLAERIAAGQGPEIASLQAWLAQQGLPAADEASATGGHGSGGHGSGGHGAMQGMVSPEEMARLMAARGPAFDRLFLELMTRHHEGAVAMARQSFGVRHPVIAEMVGEVSVTQSAEIARMQEVLAELPA
jgi:uncharacterized protein (DUF305 family)